VQDGHNNRKGQLPTLAERWRKNGREIKTLKDLLLCYYSDFSVVCIPDSNYPPTLIREQYVKLYNVIEEASKNSEKKRQSVGLSMTSEELDRYFEIGLEHFSQNPETAFNFLSSALKYNPINPTFKDHVLNLFVYMTKNFPKWSEPEILQQTERLVASCVFLDISRKRYPYRG
jgi:hypothetical protein